MKKIILFSSLIISSFVLFSQTNTFPTSGKVGIGTLAPIAKLNVNDGRIYIGSPTITDSHDLLYVAGGSPGLRQEVQRPRGSQF